MTQTSCMTWILLVRLLWIYAVCSCARSDNKQSQYIDKLNENLSNCFSNNISFLVAEHFYDVITTYKPQINNNPCIVFLINTTVNQSLNDQWPQWDGDNLYITKHIINQKAQVYVLSGNCSQIPFNITTNCDFSRNVTGSCKMTCLNTGTICKSTSYDANYCSSTQPNGMYIINITDTKKNCISCDNPVKQPQSEIKMNITVTPQEGKINPADAVNIMSKMDNLASNINGSSAALSVGDGITGILVANKDPVDIDKVSFAYASPNASIDIISSGGTLSDYSRSISLSKQAFEQAHSLNVTPTFAALLRFNNMAGDELNSTVLNNEVLAVEMGANIINLTDPINITFRNMKYTWIPSCHSWNGEGSQPNWTDKGCNTITNGTSITCQCSHLTFFAILMTPPNNTISSTDLNNLTIITQVGCGLSMFFLSIVLFMHFLMRKNKASKVTRILIHLVTAVFMLDFTFLINNFVANLKNSVVCKIMGASMHYFMLVTFSWFAMHAFHLCLQLYMGGKIQIQHYVLKVSITSWAFPSLVVVILLIVGKYGESVIYTDNTNNNVAMCWITDSNIHYIVNIGYYALVFLFTFTTFIIILSWLICLRRTKGGTKQINRNGKCIVTILGLCCMLGITWGCAFFAYGVLLIPSCYIFTVLNSFQGFFLFIYYYNTRHSPPIDADTSVNTKSTTTLQTSLDILDNPYNNMDRKNL